MPLFHHVDLRVMWSDTDPASMICEASYRVACVDAQTFAPRAFPSEIASILAPAHPNQEP